jgi:hypothetical protein
MVSHHLDGFSSLKGLGLLRPNARQDSLNFRPVGPPSEDAGHHVPSRQCFFTPFEVFPSLVAVPHHCGRCPLGVRLVNVPLADLAAIVAFILSGLTCESDPKTHPQPK